MKNTIKIELNNQPSFVSFREAQDLCGLFQIVDNGEVSSPPRFLFFNSQTSDIAYIREGLGISCISGTHGWGNEKFIPVDATIRFLRE